MNYLYLLLKKFVNHLNLRLPKTLIILILLSIITCNGYGQSIEQAKSYYKQDSTAKALSIINQLDQENKEVKKLKQQVENKHQELIIKYQLQILAEREDKKWEEKRNEKIYGGIPSINKNMEWQDNLTPKEKYVGVIKIDSSVNASEIIEAFILTYQPLQDANLMTSQMRKNNSIGTISSTLNGDMNSINEFAKSGNANIRNQYQGRTSWTVQFIDGVRLSRFYYNVTIQAKDGRYKITVIPSGLSGYALDHIQTQWSQMFNSNGIKSRYSKYYDQMKTKLAYTINKWIIEVDKHLESNDDW